VPYDARGASLDDSQASPHLDGISRSVLSRCYYAESPKERDNFRDSGGSWGVKSDPSEDEGAPYKDGNVNSTQRV